MNVMRFSYTASAVAPRDEPCGAVEVPVYSMGPANLTLLPAADQGTWSTTLHKMKKDLRKIEKEWRKSKTQNAKLEYVLSY